MHAQGCEPGRLGRRRARPCHSGVPVMGPLCCGGAGAARGMLLPWLPRIPASWLRQSGVSAFAVPQAPVTPSVPRVDTWTAEKPIRRGRGAARDNSVRCGAWQVLICRMEEE